MTATMHDPSRGLAAQRVELLGRPIGPVKHLHTERARLADLTWNSFDVKRLGSTVGAELHGVRLADDLADEVIDEILRALHEYKVIFFRDQQLTAEQHVAFAGRFGELEVHPFIPGNTTVPELVRFEKSADVGGYENSWHHDVTWRETPSMGAVLHAVQIPETGGDTLFCDMYAAYDGLDEATKQRIDILDAEHDFLRSFGRVVPADKMEETRAKYPVVVHPVAPAHAATGRRHLYVNRNFTMRILGLPEDESTALLDGLCAQSEIAEYQCRFRWEPDSVAFWDNRAVQHYAASDYWPDIRIMERASIVDTRPSR